jgi:hypothetical protein
MPYNKENKKAYYEANREEIIARKTAYYEANREEIIARQTAYYEANREEIIARQTAYYEANREEIIARKTAYCEANREEIIARQTSYRMEHPIRTMLYGAKRRAIAAGLSFDLVETDIHIPELCPVFGTPFMRGTRGNCTNSLSLDRIDSTMGYVKGNVWVISHRANTIKNDATLLELEKLVTALKKRLKAQCRKTLIQSAPSQTQQPHRALMKMRGQKIHTTSPSRKIGRTLARGSTNA